MTTAVQTEKRCAKCGEVKAAAHFYTKTTGRLRSQCKSCDVESAREWQRAHPKRMQAANAAYNASHREARNAYAAAYRIAHPASAAAYHTANREQVLARHTAYRTANRDQELARGAAWRAANPETARASTAAWRRTHPGIGAHYCASRRARKTGNGGSHTLTEWLDKCALLGNVCLYCGKAGPLTRDHKVPLVLGGTDDIANIVPACRSCNSRKGTRTDTEFLSWRAA